MDPVAEFLRAEAVGGFALLLGAFVALVWVNLIDAGSYESLWSTELRIGVGDAAITETLGHWVNDGLMTLFFFLISLEIKREIVSGDLRHPKAASLRIFAALGGVLLPVAIFLLLVGGDGAGGWGIPMATDAAFAIGVLAILGDRVGVGVKLFLVTVAVVDDVAAICVIAIAYTSDLSLGWLTIALAGLLGVVAMRALGVRRVLAYVPIGVAVWVAMLESGVHATLAGVALALLTPARPLDGRAVLEELEARLHPFTSLLVLPLFALANAGVELGGSALSDSEGRAGRVGSRGGPRRRQVPWHSGRDPRCPEAASWNPAGRSRPAWPSRCRGARRDRLHRIPVHRAPRLFQRRPGRGSEARDLRRLGNRRAGRDRDPRARWPSSAGFT